MYLQANPAKGKTEQEKEDMRRHYTPGDDVIPPVVLAGSDDDSEDERLLEQVRELSVADLDPAVAANRRDLGRSRERRPRRGNSPRDQEVRRLEGNEHSRRRQHAVERNISHQSSLRSLLSADGENSAEIQQEILASILSSGMLDNIDIDHLTAEQEEELTERIANAYRARHRQLQHARRDEEQARTPGTQHTHHTASATNQSTPLQQVGDRPTRSHLIDQWVQESSRPARRPVNSAAPAHREVSNTSATTAGASLTPPRAATSPQIQANAPSDSADRHRRVTNNRSGSDPQRPRSPSALRTGTASGHLSRPSTESRRNVSQQSMDAQQSSVGTPPSTAQAPPHSVTDAVDMMLTSRRPDHQMPPTHDNPADNLAAVQLAADIPYISCNRCNRSNIQHELHYHCDKCQGGNFDLCLKCYRAGLGCNHWFGFGYASQARFERISHEGGLGPGQDGPHVLAARRYRPRSEFSFQTDNLTTWRSLQEGAFCERCRKCANECYWHCAVCQEGAWGFCTECVAQGKHCTHPLLATAYDPVQSTTSMGVHLPNMKPNSMVLVVRCTDCDNCGKNIRREGAYLHCNKCNNGDYDLCINCLETLAALGKVAADRKQCLQGHGLTRIQFRSTQTPGILQRVVLEEPVDISTSSSSPGSRCLALWPWFPADGVEDELTFPKFAELRNVQQMNEDYHVGAYAGDTGLFPSNHVRPI